MADNILIDQGSGVPVATDEVSGVHYQQVKLVDGTADSATPVATGDGTKTNALRVVLATDGAVVPGTGATNLGKAEDAAHGDGDVGVMALAIRDDTIGAMSGTEHDYEPLHTNKNGALYVETVPGAAWYANYDGTAAQTNYQLKAAPGAGLSLYVTDIMVTNDSTAAITIKFLDGSGGTNLTGTHKVPTDGGFVLNLRTPIKLTANTALCFTSTDTSNYSVFVAGYTAP